MCDAHGLADASRSWRTTLILFLVAWVIPLGMLQLVILGSLLSGSAFAVALGPVVVLLVLVALLPLVHFFVSTSRTARAAEDGVRGMPDPDLA